MNGTVTDEQIAGSAAGATAAANGMIGWTNESMSVTGAHWDYGFPTVCLFLDAMAPDVAVSEFGYDNGAMYARAGLDGDEASSDSAYYFWMYFYRMINLSNSLLKASGSPADGSDIESLTVAQAASIGQALTYRALSYYYLSCIFEYRGTLSSENFSGLTVPWIGPETTELEARSNPRVTVDEMFNDHILKDLNAAVIYLDKYQRPTNAYVDASVAYGFLARANLWMGNYTEAAEAARNAINRDRGTMLTEAEWTNPQTGFNTLSTPSWMWGVDITSDDDCVKTGICNWVSYWSSEASFGYAGQNNGSSGKLCDARLYASIPDSDWRKKSWVDTDREKYDYQFLRGEDWLEDIYDFQNIKFRPGNGNTGNSAVAAVADFVLMRVEEMYLIEAEATAQANLAEGKALLETFAKTRDAEFESSASDFESFQKEVFKQAQIEFWGEGIIYFYYKRLNMPVMRGYVGTNHFAECRYNYPDGFVPDWTPQIPLSEVSTNIELAKQQNPSVSSMRSELWKEK